MPRSATPPRPRAARTSARLATLVATIVTVLVVQPAIAATPPTPPGPDDGLGYYHPVSPVRIKDTRSGSAIGAASSIQVTVTGVAGVPASAAAVVVNVTAIKPTRGTYLTVYPSGKPRPTASNLNVPAGATIANLVVAKVGSGGRIAVYNNAGSTHVAIDIAGWYDDVLQPFPGVDVGGSRFTAIGPHRARDTRTTATPIGPGASFAVDVTGVGGAGGSVPSTGVRAVAVNITAVSPTRGTYLTVYPDGESRPVASNLNVTAGTTAPNLAIVKVGANGNIRIYNNSGSTHVIVDIAGWYGDASAPLSGGEFTANDPVRVVDTRPGLPLGPMATGTLLVAGAAALPRAGLGAVVLNVTAVKPTASTYLTVYPSGEARPTASNLNVTAGSTRPNLVIVKVGVDGKIKVYNQAGSVDVLIDVLGWYVGDGATDDTPFSAAAGAPTGGTAATLGAATDSGVPAASFANPLSPQETADFWTPDRLAEVETAAVPMDLPNRDPDGSGGDIASVGTGRELWLHDQRYFDEGEQPPQVGRLLFRIPTSHTDIRGDSVPAGSYSCSGALVARNLVLTAAHCVVSRTQAGANLWFDQFVFVPGLYGSSAPSGVWTNWLETWAPGDDDGPYYTWAVNGEDGQEGNFWAADYAFIGFGADDGEYPGDVAGFLPIAVPPWGTWVQDVGYPRSGGFGTYCVAGTAPTTSCHPFLGWTYFQESLEHADGWWEVGVGSRMTGGSSGGPMLSLQDGEFSVSSVNSNGMQYVQDGVTWGFNMWGPWFNDVTFDLYDAIAIP